MSYLKSFLEDKQIYIYLLFIMMGVGFGLLFDRASLIFEPFISILIAILLFSMFAQIPFYLYVKRYQILNFCGTYYF